MMATTPLFLYALGGRCVQGFRPIRYSLSRISSLSQNKFRRALSSQNQFVFDKTTLHSLERNIDEELKEKKLGKKAARRKSKLQEKQRNLRLKEIFENGGQHEGDSDGNFVIPQLYSVKVDDMKMKLLTYFGVVIILGLQIYLRHHSAYMLFPGICVQGIARRVENEW